MQMVEVTHLVRNLVQVEQNSDEWNTAELVSSELGGVSATVTGSSEQIPDDRHRALSGVSRISQWLKAHLISSL